MNDQIYTTDVRVICTFSDGSEHTFVLEGFARRSTSGQVTWDRSRAGTIAQAACRRAGIGEAVSMRMFLIKSA